MSLILPGNAIPSHVLAGKTFSAGPNYNASGTIPTVAGGNTITPNTTTQQAIGGASFVTSVINVAGDPNLVASKIKSGLSIFGVAGSVIAGKPYATGNGTSSAGSISFTTRGGGAQSFSYVTASGLSFPNGIDTIVLMSTTPDGRGITYTSHSFCSDTNVHVNMYGYYIQTTGSGAAYVNTTGFLLPYGGSNNNPVTWYVWGL